MPLTDAKIRALHGKALKGEIVGKAADGGGLNFQNGKYWRMSYRFDGKQKTLALGVYPDISLKAAREARDKARTLLAQGIDPNEQKKSRRDEAERQQKEEARTFEFVAREWFDKKTRNLSPAYRKQKLQRVEKHLFPYIGRTPMATLDLPEIVAALDHLRDKPDMGKRIAQIAGQICRYARLMQYAKYDVSAGIVEALPDSPPTQHRATITDPKEVGHLLRAIDSYNGDLSIRYALRILPYVFLRSKELRLAQWKEIDLEKGVWLVPSHHMKMKRPHVVPLSKQVAALLQELYDWTGHGELIFPSPFSNTSPISDVGLLNALRRMGYGREEMCVHGFRAMASTLLNECGRYRHDVIEAQLAHQEKNAVRNAYNHAQYLPERKIMMQEWADWLDEMRASEN